MQPTQLQKDEGNGEQAEGEMCMAMSNLDLCPFYSAIRPPKNRLGGVRCILGNTNYLLGRKKVVINKAVYKYIVLIISIINTIAGDTLQAQLFGAFLPKCLTCMHIFNCIGGKGSEGSESVISNQMRHGYLYQKTGRKEEQSLDK